MKKSVKFVCTAAAVVFTVGVIAIAMFLQSLPGMNAPARQPESSQPQEPAGPLWGCETGNGETPPPDSPGVSNAGHTSSAVSTEEAFAALEQYTYELEEHFPDSPDPDRPNYNRCFMLREDVLYYLWEEPRLKEDGSADGTKLTQIMSYDLKTKASTPFFSASDYGLEEILLFTFDPDGTLYVTYPQDGKMCVLSMGADAQPKTVELDYQFQEGFQTWRGEVFLVDNSHRLHLAEPWGSAILVFDENGSLLQKNQPAEIGHVLYLAQFSDGIYASSRLSDMLLTKIDPATWELGDSLSFPSDINCNICSAEAIGLAYCWVGNGDLRVTDGKGTVKTLCSFADHGLTEFSPRFLTMTDAGDILICTYNRVVLLKRVPKGDQERTVLRLVTLHSNDPLRDAAARFNRESSNYMVKIDDYSIYNTETDPYAGQTKLNTEILGDNPPDILNLPGLDVESYIKLGILEDLYPYLDSDPEFKRDDFLPNVLEAMGDGEKLYGLTTTFRINTVAARNSAAHKVDWNFSGVQKAVSENPQAFLGMSQKDFLDLVCSYMLSNFVDWEKPEASFDSPSFISLLETCSLLPAAADERGLYDLKSHPNDQVWFVPMPVEYLTDSRDCELAFGEPEIFLGYPESGSTVSPRLYLSMISSGKNRDGVWSFLRTLLSATLQESDAEWNFQGFPIRKDSLEDMVQRSMHPETTEYLGNVQTGEMEEMQPPTEEQVNRVLELLYNTSTLESTNTWIKDIVLEEADAYFSGRKTAEETVAIIQNRVMTYINEKALS